jgi:AcrR family transcriptional regulator
MASEATQDRILDAALSAMETHGVSRVSVGDIAKRADLSRQTLYRYFRVKGELLAAVIERETDRIVEQIGAATADPANPEDALSAGLATAVRAAQDHAVLQRALETDREVLVSYLTSSPGVGEPARPALARLLASVFDDLAQEDAERVADLTVRVVVSWILNPPPEPLEDAAAGVARVLVKGLDSTVDLREAARSN